MTFGRHMAKRKWNEERKKATNNNSNKIVKMQMKFGIWNFLFRFQQAQGAAGKKAAPAPATPKIDVK